MEWQYYEKGPLRQQIESMLQSATVEKMRLEAGQAPARLTSAMHRYEDSSIDDSIINNGFVVDFSEWKYGINADQPLQPHAPPELPATATTTPNSTRHMHLGVHSEESVELQGMHVWERSSSTGGAGAPALGQARSSSRTRTRRAQQRKQRMLDTLLLRNSKAIHRPGPASVGADSARSHRAPSTFTPARAMDVEGLARSQGYLNLEGYKKSSLAAARRFMRAGSAAHEAREAMLAQEEARARKLKRRQRKQRGSKATRKAIREAGKTVRKVQRQRPRSAMPLSRGGMGGSAGAAASSPARPRAAKPNPRPVSSQGARSIARYPRLQTLPSHTPRLDLRGLGSAGAMQKVHAFVRGAACVYEEARVSTRRGLLERAALGARRVRRMEHLQELDQLQVPMGARLRLPGGVGRRRKKKKTKRKKKDRVEQVDEDWGDTNSYDRTEEGGGWQHAQARVQYERQGPPASQTSTSSDEWSGGENEEYDEGEDEDEGSLRIEATSENCDDPQSTPGFHPTPVWFPRLMGAMYGIEEEAGGEGEEANRYPEGSGRGGASSSGSSRGTVDSSTSSMGGTQGTKYMQGHHTDGEHARAPVDSNGNNRSELEASKTESMHGGATAMQHSRSVEGASMVPPDSSGDFFTVPGGGPAVHWQPHFRPSSVNLLAVGSMDTRPASCSADITAGARRNRPKSALASASSSRQPMGHGSSHGRRRVSVSFEPGLSQLSRDTSQVLEHGSTGEDTRGEDKSRRRRRRRNVRARRASLSLSPPSRGSPAVSTVGSTSRGTQPEGPSPGYQAHVVGRRGSRDWHAPLPGAAVDAEVLQPRSPAGTSNRTMQPAEAALRARGPENSGPGKKGHGGRKNYRIISSARGTVSHPSGRQGSNGNPVPRPIHWMRPAVGIQGGDVELLRMSYPTLG